MKNVQKKMEPFISDRSPDVKELIKALPDMIRICPEHGKEVMTRESDSLPQQSGVLHAPSNFEGCCDAAIEGVTEILKLIDRAKKRYKEELAPLLA